MFNIPGGAVGLSVIRKISDLWMASKSDSLVDYTAPTRVEPIALIDADCMYSPMLVDVMQSLQSLFTGYYLQAMAISTNVGKIEVMRHLDKLNPSRSPINSGVDTAGWVMSMESYKHRLPTSKNKLAMEAEQGEYVAMISKDSIASVKELTNLSVGKLVSVEISDGCNKATVLVSLRLMATSVPSSNIINILTESNQDNSAKERYHGWKSGRLEFLRDIIFCQDLVDARKKTLKEDKLNVYSEILNRRRNNQLSTLVSGNPSVATASNLLVVSNETLKTFEGQTGLNFKDFKTREAIFKKTYLMIVAVIDKEWERVTFYTRGIATATQLGSHDLKAANKNTGPDIAQILQAYQLGSSPSL